MTHDEIDAIIMNKFSGKDIPANIYNIFELGMETGRNEVITELLETSKKDLVDIAWDILNRGIEKGKELARDEVIEKIKSGEYCSSSACKHYYEISDHFVDGDCTRECEDSIIEMIERMKGENV